MRNERTEISVRARTRAEATSGEVPDGTKRGSLIDRHAAAKILEMSHSSLRRMEGGELHPIRDARGRWWFNEDEVRALALERQRTAASDPTTVYDGPLAAKVFRLLDVGKGIAEIVTALEVHPTTARTLAREWADLRGGFFVSAETLARIEELPCVYGAEAITGERELIATLAEAQLDDCRVCKEDGRPAVCIRCILRRPHEVLAVAKADAARREKHRQQLREREIQTAAAKRAAASAGRDPPIQPTPSQRPSR